MDQIVRFRDWPARVFSGIPRKNCLGTLSGLVEMSKRYVVRRRVPPGDAAALLEAAASQANRLFHLLGQLGAAVEFNIDPLSVFTLLDSGISHDIAELVKVTRT